MNHLIIAVAIIGLIFIAYMIPKKIKEGEEWTAKCIQAGGVPFKPRDAKICFDSKLVIRP